jgi:hypothetical protein
MPVGQLQRLSQSQAFKPPDFRYWKIERAFAPKGLYDSARGFNPGNRPKPHRALTRHYSVAPSRKTPGAPGLEVLKGRQIDCPKKFQKRCNCRPIQRAHRPNGFCPRRDRLIVTRHEVPGSRCREAPVSEGRSKSLSVPQIFVVETELRPLEKR